MNGSRYVASLGRLRRGSAVGGMLAWPALPVRTPPALLAFALSAFTRGMALVLALVAFTPPAFAQTAPAQVSPAAPTGLSAPGLPISPDPRAGSAPCTDCRGGEVGGPGSSNTIIVTPENKTIVPRTIMREQSDFRVNEALRNVPGVNRR